MRHRKQIWDNRVPAPLYGCNSTGCAEQKSVRAAEMWWYRDGFYCETCIDGMKYEARLAPVQHHTGATLAKLLADGKRAGVTPRQAPDPVYPCAVHECAMEVSYPAAMLTWYRDGFYCYECINEVAPGPDDTPESEAKWDARHNGPSLAEVTSTWDEAAYAEHLDRLLDACTAQRDGSRRDRVRLAGLTLACDPAHHRRR